jgi:hypothetical protein
MIDDDGATTTGIVAPGRHDDGFQMNDGTLAHSLCYRIP